MFVIVLFDVFVHYLHLKLAMHYTTYLVCCRSIKWHVKSTFICCRTRAAARLEKRKSDSTDHGAEHQWEFFGDPNISFNVVASVDARTLPLAMLKSNHVCLVVEDVSEHRDRNCSPNVDISKMNFCRDDISFEQLMMQLALLQRMLVSKRQFLT